MKSPLFFILLFCATFIVAQKLDQGIASYENGDYEKSISLLNSAIVPNSLPDADKANAHYYRAMARIKLEKRDPEAFALGLNPHVIVTKDLLVFRSLSERNDEVEELLFSFRSQLMKEAKKIRKNAERAESDELKIGQIKSAVQYYDAAYQIERDFEVNETLGYLYKALGDHYYQTRETETAYAKAFVQYELAMRHLEEAYNEYHLSQEINDAIAEISPRLSEGGSLKEINNPGKMAKDQ